MTTLVLSEDCLRQDDLVGSHLSVTPKTVLWDVYPHEYRDNKEVIVCVEEVTEEIDFLPTRYLEQEKSIRLQISGNLIRINSSISVKFWVLEDTKLSLNEN